MSKLKQLIEEIRSLLEEGYRPVTISVMLDVSVDMVYQVAELTEVDSHL